MVSSGATSEPGPQYPRSLLLPIEHFRMGAKSQPAFPFLILICDAHDFKLSWQGTVFLVMAA